VRLWGEDLALIQRAGADLVTLGRLEGALDDAVADVPREKAIDAHVHLGRDADGHVMAAATLLEDLDRWRIATAVCFPANEPGEDGRFTAANAAVTDAARASAGRIIPFCRVDPMAGGAVMTMSRAESDGARGLKLHPVAQRLRPESPEVVEVVADATARGWPVLIHAGFGARPLAGPIGALVEAVPGARLILAHGGRGDARALAARLPEWPDVVLDTSLATLADVSVLPPERLVFGSDRPYGEHATALRLASLAARLGGWSAEQTAGVMGGNLREWLP